MALCFYSKSMEFLLLNHLELRQETLENKSLYHSYFFIGWKTGFMVNKNTIYREIVSIGNELDCRLILTILRHSFAIALVENGCDVRIFKRSWDMHLY